MYKPPLMSNYELLYRVYRGLQDYPQATLPQLICDCLRNYLRQSKYYNRLTDDSLQLKTQNLLSGQYNPDEPIDVFLYPPHDPYTYRNPYTIIDALKTALYLVSDPVQSLFRKLVIHDLATDIFTAITDDGTVYRPTELSFLDYGEPINIKTDSDSFRDCLNNANNSLPINLTDAEHLALISHYKIVLLNLDKLHDTDYDSTYRPPELSTQSTKDDTQTITDDNLLSVDDEVSNPITDDLLAELKNTFKD